MSHIVNMSEIRSEGEHENRRVTRSDIMSERMNRGDIRE